MVEAGTVLLNKYRIDRLLGQGGMGVVALAYHLQLQQPVAIKFLLPDVLDKPQVVQRFLREAQASVRLKSEHVCRVIDVGTLETGAPYMVMEYLDGVDLGVLLQQQGRVYPGVAVDFVLQACEALAEAHALGIVHRDLKPSNFFLTRRPDGSPLIKVLDFGISKTHAQLEENLTSTQSILGTPAYMSPEQLKASKYVDARADIWSLGVVLYELMCGQRPFTASVFSELVLKVAIEPAPLPPQSLSLPPGLAEIVMCCLQKEPEGRYPSVAELAHALAPYAQTPSVASSAAERTTRILHGGGAAATGMGTRPGTSQRPGHPSFATAATGATGPQPPHLPGAGNPSTLGGSSGEIVRPAPPGGPRGMADTGAALTNGTGGAGGKRKGWLLPSAVATAIVSGVVVVAVAMGGGSGGGAAQPATQPTMTTPTTTAPATAPATEPTTSATDDGQAAAEAAKLEAAKLEAEKLAAKAEAAKLEAEKLAAAEAEKREAERLAKAKAEAEAEAEKKAKKKKRTKKRASSDEDDILGSRQ